MPPCLRLCSCLQAPLVGNPAPDFTATAVFDQEFVETKLSQYKVRRCQCHTLRWGRPTCCQWNCCSARPLAW